ncbi:hypothetical protein Megpolyxen_01573 (plasmid) [Candidatus Megaera polyxenophila]|nr:hypothetical protein Megpolyxen_01573 [Candidatus Megaera polyxenophila]
MKDLNNSQKDNLTLFDLVDNFIEKQKYLLVLFISSILIASMVLTSAEDAICKEIVHGKYQNLDKLLGPDSTLRDIKFSDNGKPLYTEQQSLELDELHLECGLRTVPLAGFYFIASKSLNNFYKKFGAKQHLYKNS